MLIKQYKQGIKKNNRLSRRWNGVVLTAALIGLISASPAIAQSFSHNSINLLSTIWMLIAAALVFFMNAGFAMLETGLCRTRNATNVLAKNLIVFCVASFAFWLVGFGLMFGDGNSFIGETGFFFDAVLPKESNPLGFPAGFRELQKVYPGRALTAVFFFQLVFAGTAATIVSGAVAERVKFWAFILFTFFLIGIAYPLTGHWVWSSVGWLLNLLQFRDFAGSAVVHSVGGVAALIGAILLKPRDGCFGYNRKLDRFESEEAEEFPPYNLSFATLGCFILWLGWFGFNGGSASDLENVPHVIATTMLAGSFGGISPIVGVYAISGTKPRLESIINGILGGLVGITASSGYVSIRDAIIIGAVSGIVVLVVEDVLKRLKIDDPVGAVPVHLGCGFWGTIAVGLFSTPESTEYATKVYFQKVNPLIQTGNQFLGWLIICVVTALLCWAAWIVIGIVLYYWDRFVNPSSQNRQNFLRTNSDPQFNLIAAAINLHEIGRKGLRVTEEQEREGSDGVFYNPNLRRLF